MRVAGPFVYLASRSPRRRALLARIGVRFELVHGEVDECPLAHEWAADYVRRLAGAKAAAGHAALGPAAAGVPVLGADTAVVVGGQVLGKPAGEAEALAMLARLSGRMHEVHSAVALATAGAIAVRSSVSRVWMRVLSQAEREAYWASGEPLGKAGGYAIQGLAGAFVTRLDGSYSGVVGLPLCETAELLAAAGMPVLARI